MKFFKLSSVIGSFLVASSAFAQAPSIKCSLDVLTTVCSSSRIEVELVPEENFTLDFGDIECWFGTFRRNGFALTSSVRPPFKGVVYDLINEKNKALIARLTYEEERKVALLKLEPNAVEGARGEQYHLSCE